MVDDLRFSFACLRASRVTRRVKVYPAFSISVIGFSRASTTSRVMTHSRIFFCPGSVYIKSSIRFSMIMRSPRAPIFRSRLPEPERLSVPQLVRDLIRGGRSAREAESIEDIIGTIVRERRTGDRVVIMSNGGFGGIHQKLLRALT